LRLGKNDREVFYEKYNVLSKENLEAEVKKSFLPYYKLIKNPLIVQYIRKYISVFVTYLFVHLNGNNFDNYICFDNK